jgi:hypothetical protein
VKSKYIVSLFAASSMLVATGCSDNDLDNYELCYDNNNDLYCDGSNELVDLDSYVVINGKREAYIIYDSDSSGYSGG